jgi:hypothetical protein
MKNVNQFVKNALAVTLGTILYDVVIFANSKYEGNDFKFDFSKYIFIFGFGLIFFKVVEEL